MTPAATGEVLVVGPPLAGAGSLVAALAGRLPGHRVTETADTPAAVVFVVSAAAPMAGSDLRLLRRAAAGADLVVGVVNKIDVHRGWRDVLARNRALTAARFRPLPWLGVAAAPEHGPPLVAALVALLAAGLADPDTARRNRLRRAEARLQGELDRAAAQHRRGRLAAARRRVELRGRLQRARVQLTHRARRRCTAARGELRAELAGLRRGRLAAFPARVRDRAAAVLAEVHADVHDQLAGLAAELALPVPPCPPPEPPAVTPPPVAVHRPEARLVAVLGAGFGLGVAAAAGRLLAGFGFTGAGLVLGALLGLAVTAWVVRLRGLLRDRAVLDRWAAEVLGDLRAAAEELVATRVVAAETAGAAALAAAEARAAPAAAGAGEAALRAALARVRAELYALPEGGASSRGGVRG
ncbi:hypothetical protein [uncultured Mycolicibacterium sp.]|uniref:hypothetical protein n=1 Tax=uncultured Mycolicibacterium sp. TaxID=2320817 RepID=UPI00260A34EC|nr:hypothetical protein [uncultured Mycolicibacterium sp.]